MTYVAILAGALFISAMVRIRFLNLEIKTLKDAGFELHALIEPSESMYPTGHATGHAQVESEEKKPKELQELEVEYSWLSNEIDSKKESRTIWYGGAFVCLVVSLLASGLAIQNSN